MQNMYLLLIITIMVMGLGCGKTKESTRQQTVEMTQAQFMEKLISNESFALPNDLTLEGWASVPEYKGKLEGKGKKVIIKSFKGETKGLISQISKEALVKNLEIELVGGLTTSARIAGVLAGTNKGIIEGVKVAGKVKVKGDEVGGLVGWNEGSIKRSTAKVNVIGNSYVGGLVGINFNVIENTYATGDVTSNKSGSSVGGLVGYNQLHVKRSYATGDVEGVAKVGGLVGFSYGTIERSYATGEVKGRVSVGGLVGYNEDATIEGSYSTGAVEGGKFAGGLVGEHRGTHWTATIKKSYATGNVKGKTIGGLVGWNDAGTIENSFIKKGMQAVGKGKKDGVEAISQSDIKATTFTNAGWLSSVWKNLVGGQWPKLLWQP